ncbi:hypothetical protein PHMEG_00030095, partial [Phytophthora megakarya]
MLEVCENTKDVLRDEYLNADPSTSRDSLAELLAQAGFDAERGEPAGHLDPKKVSADMKRTSPGTLAQEVAEYFQQKRAPGKSSASVPKRKVSSPRATASQTPKRPRRESSGNRVPPLTLPRGSVAGQFVQSSAKAQTAALASRSRSIPRSNLISEKDSSKKTTSRPRSKSLSKSSPNSPVPLALADDSVGGPDRVPAVLDLISDDEDPSPPRADLIPKSRSSRARKRSVGPSNTIAANRPRPAQAARTSFKASLLVEQECATDADVLEKDIDMEDHQDEVPISKSSKLRRLKRSALFDSSESSGESGHDFPPYEYSEGEISGAEALTDLNSQSSVVETEAIEPLETSPPPNPTEEKICRATVAFSSVPLEPSRPAEPSGGTQSTSPIVIQRKPRAKGKPTKKTRSGSCFQTSVSSRRVLTASPKLSLTIKFPKKVLKWASGFISPPFTLRGSDKCWMRILNARVPTPIPAKLQIPCLASEIARFADYMNPQHPWQKTPCLFDTTEFDQESSLSQRAPPDLRYRGYWRNFRGAGHKKDPEFGFSQWERDHWIPPRAVELFITMAFTTLRLNTPNLNQLEILEIKAMLDA